MIDKQYLDKLFKFSANLNRGQMEQRIEQIKLEDEKPKEVAEEPKKSKKEKKTEAEETY